MISFRIDDLTQNSTKISFTFKSYYLTAIDIGLFHIDFIVSLIHVKRIAKSLDNHLLHAIKRNKVWDPDMDFQ